MNPSLKTYLQTLQSVLAAFALMLQRWIKSAVDPNNIMNPGKIFP